MLGPERFISCTVYFDFGEGLTDLRGKQSSVRAEREISIYLFILK